MPYGIQILGKHVISDRLTRVLGKINITSNGSVTVPGDGVPFAFLEFDRLVAGPTRLPQITINGSTISWIVTDTGGLLTYGVY